MRDACLECLDLCFDSDAGGGEPRYAHLHLDVLDAALLFCLGSYLFHLANGGLGEVLYAQIGDEPVNYLLVDWGFIHDGLIKIRQSIFGAKLVIISHSD